METDQQQVQSSSILILIPITSDRGQIQPQISPQTSQLESQKTLATDEALNTQTSINMEDIVAQVVDNINAASKEEITGDGGYKEAEKPRVFLRNKFPQLRTLRTFLDPSIFDDPNKFPVKIRIKHQLGMLREIKEKIEE